MSRTPEEIATRLRDWASTICTIRGDTDPSSKAKLARDAADAILALVSERDRLRLLWSEQKSQTMTLSDQERILRDEIASLRQTIARSESSRNEWIRETQERARLIQGSLE